MKRSICIFAAAVIALAFTGCVRKDALVLRGVSDVELSFQGSPQINAVVDVENTSGKNITLRDAAFTIMAKDGSVIGKAMVADELFIPKRSFTSLHVPLRISIDNPLRGLAVLGDWEKNVPLLFVTGSITVKVGCMKKEIRVEKEPLSEFFKHLQGALLPASAGTGTEVKSSLL